MTKPMVLPVINVPLPQPVPPNMTSKLPSGDGGLVQLPTVMVPVMNKHQSQRRDVVEDVQYDYAWHLTAIFTWTTLSLKNKELLEILTLELILPLLLSGLQLLMCVVWFGKCKIRMLANLTNISNLIGRYSMSFTC
ncbi:hypothetical protein FHG87_015328 [Trinorchestia longiramus]|nr:hypothetical protein FHG87_015328 [Trinorchestia longiramus]